MLEKIIFKKIELWIVLGLAIIAIIGTVLFGSAVRHYYLGGDKLGRLGPVIASISVFPGIVKKTLSFAPSKDALLAPEQRFEGISGFQFNYPPGTRPELGYILLNRYNADSEHSVSELWDLNSQERVHTWSFAGVDAAWAESKLESKAINFVVDSAAKRFRNFHALLDENGNLFTQAGAPGSPILKADLCSSLSLFQDDAIYHHSIERDHNGNFWVPKRLDPKSVEIGSSQFDDDGITQISPNGKVLFEKSVIQILDENGLGYLIYGKGPSNDDPIHLNDIQPALTDGKFWKQGDVFLSLRHQSMIVLYRPSTNKIIWHHQGPWINQHDVDIIDNEKISIFNNNAVLTKGNHVFVRGTNSVLVYNFRTQTIQSPFEAGFITNDLRTKTEGRSSLIDNEVLVEENNYGRLIQFTPQGNISWQFINRAMDGKIYMLNWSRPISRELGNRTRSLVSKKVCS